MVAGIKGHGKLIAYTLRGNSLVAAKTLATFKNAGSNGSEELTGVRLSARKLSWQPTCGASSYKVTIRQGHVSSVHSTRATRLTLASSHRPVTIMLAALAPDDTVLGTTDRTFKR